MNLKITNIKCTNPELYRKLGHELESDPVIIITDADFKKVGSKLIKLFQEGMVKCDVSVPKENIE